VDTLLAYVEKPTLETVISYKMVTEARVALAEVCLWNHGAMRLPTLGHTYGKTGVKQT